MTWHTHKKVSEITLEIEAIPTLSQSSHHCDTLIRLGTGYQGNPILELRLNPV